MYHLDFFYATFFFIGKDTGGMVILARKLQERGTIYIYIYMYKSAPVIYGVRCLVLSIILLFHSLWRGKKS